MTTNDLFGLTRESVLKLQRTVDQQQLTITRLERDLRRMGVQRHQAVWMPSKVGPAVAKLSGTMNACDTTTHHITGASFAGMPAAAADIYEFTADGKMQQTADEIQIYNPTPFKYPNLTYVWVRKVGNLWLIDRAYEDEPYASLSATSLTVDSSYRAIWTSFSLLGFGDVAEKDGSDATKINIKCPTNGLKSYRVQLAALIRARTGTGWSGGLTLAVNASNIAVATNTQSPVTASASPGTNTALSSPNTHSHTVNAHTHTLEPNSSHVPVFMDFPTPLQKNDYIQVYVSESGSGHSAVRVDSLYLNIKPMFA